MRLYVQKNLSLTNRKSPTLYRDIFKNRLEPDVVHALNPSTPEADIRGSLSRPA